MPVLDQRPQHDMRIGLTQSGDFTNLKNTIGMTDAHIVLGALIKHRHGAAVLPGSVGETIRDFRYDQQDAYTNWVSVMPNIAPKYNGEVNALRGVVRNANLHAVPTPDVANVAQANQVALNAITNSP